MEPRYSMLNRFLESKAFVLIKVGICLTLTQTGWGGYPVILKLYTNAVVIEGVRPIKSIKDFIVIALLGMFNMCMGQTILPVSTSFLSVIFGFEHIGLRKIWGWIKIIGILISFGGMMWMIFASFSTGIKFNWAAILFLVQISISTSYLLLQKYFFFQYNKDTGETSIIYPPWTLTAYVYYFSTIGMALLEIPNDVINRNTFSNFSTQIIVPLVYATLISSVMCFGFVSYANSLTSATVVSAFYPLQAVATMILSWIVLSQPPSTQDLLSGGLICFGVFLVCFSKYLEDNERENLKSEILTEVDVINVENNSEEI